MLFCINNPYAPMTTNYKKANMEKIETIIEYAETLLNSGIAKTRSGDSGYSDFKKVIEICEEYCEVSSSTMLRRILAKGYYYMGKEKPWCSSAQKTYLYKARDMCEFLVRTKPTMEDRRLLVDIYMSIADFSLLEANNETDQYISVCERAKRICEQLVQENNEAVDMIALGSVYEDMASLLLHAESKKDDPNFCRAEFLFTEAIRVFKEVLEQNNNSKAEAFLKHCYSDLFYIKEITGALNKTEDECLKEFDELMEAIKQKRSARSKEKSL